MKKVNYDFTLDLKSKDSGVVIYAKNSDVGSRTLRIKLRSGGDPYVPDSDSRAYLYGAGDSNYFIDCAVEGGTVSCDIPGSILEQPITLCEIRISDSEGAVLTTSTFKIVSEKAVFSEEAIAGTNQYSALLSAIARAENAVIESAEVVDGDLIIAYKNGLQVSAGRVVGEKGEKGDKGDTGETGPAGERGVSGVYVGSGEMPEGYNVQIDPEGGADLLPKLTFTGAVEAVYDGSKAVTVKIPKGGSGGTAVELDTTLSVEGKAADAAAVGKAIPKKLSELTNDKGFLTEDAKVFYITLTDTEDGNCTADKTPEEVVEAYQKGYTLVVDAPIVDVSNQNIERGLYPLISGSVTTEAVGAVIYSFVFELHRSFMETVRTHRAYYSGNYYEGNNETTIYRTSDTISVPSANTINGIKDDVATLYLMAGGNTEKLAEKITSPDTASVGQTIVVSEVDEDGKPTAWKASEVYNKTQIDTMMGTYITEVAELVGGDA